MRAIKPKSITLDIDSHVVNVKGYQDSAVKHYNPKKLENSYYNIRLLSVAKLSLPDWLY